MDGRPHHLLVLPASLSQASTAWILPNACLFNLSVALSGSGVTFRSRSSLPARRRASPLLLGLLHGVLPHPLSSGCFTWLAPVRLLRPEGHLLLEVLPDHSHPSLVFPAGWLRHGETLAPLSLTEQRGPWGQDLICLPSAIPASGPEPALSGVVNYWRSGCPGTWVTGWWALVGDLGGGAWLSPRWGGAPGSPAQSRPVQIRRQRGACSLQKRRALRAGDRLLLWGDRQGPPGAPDPSCQHLGQKPPGTPPARCGRGPSGAPASTSQDPRAN